MTSETQISSSLPEAWTQRIFEKMVLVYGKDFLSRWEGQTIEAVMDDWGHELRGFQQSPNAIRHGLENLPPDRPPTVLQFRDACLKAPQYAPAALPAPKADPGVVAAVIGAIQRPVVGSYDPKAWAHRLRARLESGERIPMAHVEMMRAALRHHGDEHDDA